MSQVLLSITLLVILSIFVSSVTCEESEGEKIIKEICKDKKRHGIWYKCIACCQNLNCYEMKKGKDPHSETRNELYHKKALNIYTKVKQCKDLEKYSDKLKDWVLELKGDQKEECADTDGMKEFFQMKVECFQNCHEDPGKNSDMCPDLKEENEKNEGEEKHEKKEKKEKKGKKN